MPLYAAVHTARIYIYIYIYLHIHIHILPLACDECRRILPPCARQRRPTNRVPRDSTRIPGVVRRTLGARWRPRGAYSPLCLFGDTPCALASRISGQVARRNAQSEPARRQRASPMRSERRPCPGCGRHWRLSRGCVSATLARIRVPRPVQDAGAVQSMSRFPPSSSSDACRMPNVVMSLVSQRV